MTNEQFQTLVSQLEKEASLSPNSYKLRVFLLALLGYAYIGSIVALLLLFMVLALVSIVYLKAVAIKVVIPIAAVVWLVLKAMWLRIPPPNGWEVKRHHSPELFALIDRLRRQLRMPRLHHVLITGEFNAGITQTPCLGLFGWHRNYLLLGLPLMKMLTPAQFEAVLAHEFGHLAGGHGRMSNWIYRLRLTWARLLSALEQANSWGIMFFRPFFNWYTPYFNAYSFPLARTNEYEADAVSRRIVSAKATAEALTSVNVIGEYLNERFWPQLHQRADEQPQPAFAPYSQMGEGLSIELDEKSIDQWLAQSMTHVTSVADTHPSLADRLKALNEPPRLALPVAGSTAAALLGQALPIAIAHFDRLWHEAILPTWEKRHREVQTGRTRLRELDELAKSDSELAVKESYERAMLTLSFGAGVEAAFEQICQLRDREPDDLQVLFSLGRLMLILDDERGIDIIEQVMRLDENAIVPGCELLRDYCWRKGREAEARTFHERLTQRVAVERGAKEEREQVMLTEKFDAHGLPNEVIADLRTQLQGISLLKRAYLVRKRPRYMPDRPCFAVGFTTAAWWQLLNKKRVAVVQDVIMQTIRFPGEAIIFNIEGGNRRFARKLRSICGARII